MKKFDIISFLGIETGSNLHQLIDASVDVVPILGKIHNALKMARLQKRVSQHEKRLSDLSIAMYHSNNRLIHDFIRQTAFPIVLDELLSEHEEEKIDLVLNGLEYTYKEGITDESRLLVYFDVLRELRVEELKILIKYTDHYKQHWGNELLVFLTPPDDELGMKKQKANRGYMDYIENHLSTLGLTEIEQADGFVTNKVLTDFGILFVDFFDLKTLTKLPAN
nr:hypothetical protein [Paenibacillus xylanexedens]